VLELFLVFSGMTLLGFGSVLPVVHRTVVERRRWVTEKEFAEIWAVCQVLPGANVINLSIIVGRRLRGAPGAFACALGMLAVPLIVAIGAATLYLQYGDRPAVRGALQGLAAAAAGLMFSTAWKISRPIHGRGKAHALAVAAATFVGVALMRLPLPLVFVVLAPVSIWAAARRRP
jgi:chromate transporter